MVSEDEPGTSRPDQQLECSRSLLRTPLIRAEQSSRSRRWSQLIDKGPRGGADGRHHNHGSTGPGDPLQLQR
jgi:hypothetical protein